MVLKSVVRYIINRYLKNYIEQLDDDKLHFDLKNGKVSLENLHLKHEALADLNLPVTVAAGYIEKFTLTIPWMHLYTNPTRVHIGGLYILIVPKNEYDQDLTEYHANKMRRVQRKVDDQRKAMLENKKLDEKEATFFERMRLQIMRNIEIILENFHISYETKSTTKLGHPFSFGFTLHYLKLTTVIDTSARKRTEEITPITYTLNEINLLSIYWNTKCQSRVHMPFDFIVDDLKSKIATEKCKSKGDHMNYILYPVNLDMNVMIMITPGEHSFDRSTFNINVLIKDLTLNIDSKQFSDLLDFAKFQNYSTLYERCREYRDLHFQESLHSTELTQLQRDRLKILETKLDVFNLAYIRRSVEIEIENQIRRNSSEENLSNKNSYRWNWWQKRKYKSTHDERKSITTKEETCYKDGFSFYLEDLSNILIDIRINELHLNLVSKNLSSDQIITYVHVIDSQINVTKRSISSSLLTILNFRSFQLFGINDPISQSPLLVRSLSPNSHPMLHMELEFFPIHSTNSDCRFYLNIQPIDILYDARMFNMIVQCFETNTNSNAFLLSEIKERRHSQIENDLSSKQIFDMTIELKHISIRFSQESCSIVHIYFDRFILKSSLDTNVNVIENNFNSYNDIKTKQIDERFYVKYLLQTKNLGIRSSYADGTYLNFFRDISFVDMQFFKCIYSDDAFLDDWLIDVRIDRIEDMKISKGILENFFAHFQSIPQFNTTVSEIIGRINSYFELFRSNTSLKANISIEQISFVIEHLPVVFIETNLKSLILKKRNQLNNIILILENLIISMQNLNQSIYSNKYLQLNYTK